MITVGELHQENPKLVEKFVRKLFAKEIKEVGQDINILDNENGNLICQLGNNRVVIGVHDMTINGENVYDDKPSNVIKFMTQIYGQSFIDAVWFQRESLLDSTIEKYTVNTQRIFLELHKLSKNPIEKDVTSIGELHEKHPKLVEDFVKKLYAKEIKEAGHDMEFVYDDGGMLECKLGDKWVYVDDSAYYETDCQSKEFQVAKFLAKMCGQKYIDSAMETNLDVFQSEIKHHNAKTHKILETAKEVLVKANKKETEFKI